MSSFKNWVSNLMPSKSKEPIVPKEYSPEERFLNDLRNGTPVTHEAAQKHAPLLNKFILTHLFVYHHYSRITKQQLYDDSIHDILGKNAAGLEMYTREDISWEAHVMSTSGALQRLKNEALSNLAIHISEYITYRDLKKQTNVDTIDKAELNTLLDDTMLEMSKRDIEWPMVNTGNTAKPLPIALLLSSAGKELQHKALNTLLEVAGTNDVRTPEQSKHFKTLYGHLLDIANDIPRSTLNNLSMVNPTSKLLTMVDNLRDSKMDNHTPEGLRVIPHVEAIEEMITTTHNLGMTQVSMRLAQITEDGTRNENIFNEQKLVHLAINLNNPKVVIAALCNGDKDEENNVDSNVLPYTLNAARQNPIYLNLIPVLLSNECQQGVNVKGWARHVVGFGSDAWTAALNKATPEQRDNIKKAIEQNNALTSIQPFKESLLREIVLDEYAKSNPSM